jgi:hypothetical protein
MNIVMLCFYLLYNGYFGPDVSGKPEGGDIPFVRKARSSISLLAGEVLHHHPDGFFDRLSENRLSLPFAADKVGVPELLDMVGNGGEGDVEIAGHVAD